MKVEKPSILKSSLCHSEPHGRRISRRLFASLRVTLCNKCKSQRGFTLIELLLVIGLTGIIGAAATMSIHQIFTGTALSNDQNTAINQVRNAGHWISRDVQMAKPNTIVVYEPTEQNFLGLTIWEDPNGDTTHTVTYILQDGKLWRNYDAEQTFIAQYIKPKEQGVTWCQWNGEVLTVTITAQVGDKTETRTFQVKPRPD